ncbi:MAG: ABC transporter permease [Clostridiales bacterium]|nr:ABC transporter permease [Clostridiales bacterium]
MDSMIAWLQAAIAFGTVILFGCMGEILTERSGNLNLGVPGLMYFGGIASLAGVFMYQNSVQAAIQARIEAFTAAGGAAQDWRPTGLFSFLVQQNAAAQSWDANGVLGIVIALVCGFGAAALGGLLYSFITITLRANQNVTGLTLTIFGTGVANFFGGSLVKLSGGVGQISVATTSQAFRTGLPWLSSQGVIGKIFFSYGFLVYAAVILAVLLHLFLFKTRRGLNLRAVGENPATADAAGIAITKNKYLATCLGAGITGLGGVYYVMDYIKGTWANDGTIEKLGWLAVALVIFATWKSVHAIWGAYVFGFLYWAYYYVPKVFPFIQLSRKSGELFNMLPYAVTIVVLIVVSLRRKKENQGPSSLGLPYFREER